MRCHPPPRGGDGKNGLVYESTRYFEGLQQTARLTKTPQHAYGVLEDGSVLSLPELYRRNRIGLRARYGAFTKPYHEHLQRLAPTDDTAAVVYFRPEVADWAALTRRLASQEPAVVAAAQAELVAAIEDHAVDLAERVAESGVEVTRVGRLMPALFVRATVERLMSLSDPSIEMIVENTQLEARNHHHGVQDGCYAGGNKSDVVDGGCVDPNELHHIDDVFNTLGLLGQGQKIAIYEDTGGRKLLDSHDAFLWGDVYYQNTGFSAFTPHGTAVGSVISGTHFGAACGASFADLYVPNDGPEVLGAVQTVCHPEGTLDAYEWMLSHGSASLPFEDPQMAVVNESYGCYSLANDPECNYGAVTTGEGITQDYFARYWDMMIVKAAGNRECVPYHGGPDYASDEACPFTLNALCVGSVDSQLAMSAFSSYTNPGHDPAAGAGAEEDREEPDLVAFGGQKSEGILYDAVCAANTTGDEDWTQATGTSFAAPVVSSMVALYRQKCEEELEQRFNPLFLRAWFRNQAYAGNPADTAYSTPRPDADFKDGAGFLLADALYCLPGGGGEPIDLDEDGAPMPNGDATYNDTWWPSGETQRVRPQAFNSPPNDAERVGKAIFEGLELSDGLRIRGSIAWASCPMDETGAAPASVAVDYDLFLYRRDSEEHLWASQSFDGSNEGLDYTVPAGEGGIYDVILSWPSGATSCEGTTNEPVSYVLTTF